MCTKRVVNHEDGRGGQEQKGPRRRTVSPAGLVVGRRDAGEVNLPRNVVNSHLEWVREECLSPKVSGFSASELNSAGTAQSQRG